jgi:hypothetical protein
MCSIYYTKNFDFSQALPGREALCFVRLGQIFHISVKFKPFCRAVTASILEANNIKRIYTRDRDFRKFPYLKLVDPVSG